MPHQAEGEFAQLKEQLETALDLSGQPVKRGTMAHKHIVYMMLVDSASKARDLGTILEYAPLLEELAARDNHKPYMAICHRAYGVAHISRQEFDKSEARLTQALDIFASLEMDWQTGRTLAELGSLAQAKKDRLEAHKHLSKALELFENIGAEPDIKWIREALTEIGMI